LGIKKSLDLAKYMAFKAGQTYKACDAIIVNRDKNFKIPNDKHQIQNKNQITSTKSKTNKKLQIPNPKQISNYKFQHLRQLHHFNN